MFGRIIEVMFILILVYLVVANADNFAKVVEASAGGTARLVQVLQGNVNKGGGT